MTTHTTDEVEIYNYIKQTHAPFENLECTHPYDLA
jgi:hypothetical protein